MTAQTAELQSMVDNTCNVLPPEYHGLVAQLARTAYAIGHYDQLIEMRDARLTENLRKSNREENLGFVPGGYGRPEDYTVEVL